MSIVLLQLDYWNIGMCACVISCHWNTWNTSFGLFRLTLDSTIPRPIPVNPKLGVETTNWYFWLFLLSPPNLMQWPGIRLVWSSKVFLWVSDCLSFESRGAPSIWTASSSSSTLLSTTACSLAETSFQYSTALKGRMMIHHLWGKPYHNKTENPSKDALDKTDVSTYPAKGARSSRLLTGPTRLTRPTRLQGD